MVPLSGCDCPASNDIRVDFPAPFSPRSARMRPSWISRLMSWLARTSPKDLEIFSSFMTGVSAISSVVLFLLPGNRINELGLGIPRKQDPGVLAYLGNKGINQWPPGRFCIDGGEMSFGCHFFDHFSGTSG